MVRVSAFLIGIGVSLMLVPALAATTAMRCTYAEGPDKGTSALVFRFTYPEKPADGRQVVIPAQDKQLRQAQVSETSISILVNAVNRPPWQQSFEIDRADGRGRMTWQRSDGPAFGYAIMCAPLGGP